MEDSEKDELLAAKLEKFKPQHKVNVTTPADVVDVLQDIQRQRESETKSVIAQRVIVPMDKVERAIQFWKPIYFSATKEGRLLNGIEAYELGDPKITPKPDKGPFIAMCNLMALECLKMMGDHWPTVDDAKLLAFGTEREREVADFWHQQFAPTAFQADWAWKGCMAVLAGEPHSTSELLVSFRDQLP